MFDLLEIIVRLAIKALNGLIAAFAAVMEQAVDLLPDMPSLPDPPDALVTAEAWVAWFFPVNTLLDILAATLVFFIVWSAVVIGLRWAKASE